MLIEVRWMSGEQITDNNEAITVKSEIQIANHPKTSLYELGF